MARDHSIAAVASGRKQDTRKVNKVILYCEGRNTEPSYIELLKKSNCKVVPVVERGHGIGSCVEFVEEANKKYSRLPRSQRDKYNQKWLVYDCDGHEDFSSSIKMARKYGFRVAFSNMCIEFWFALHFFDLVGQPIGMKGSSHSQALIDIVNRAIEQYNRKALVKVNPYDRGRKVVEEDFFDLMMAINPETHNKRLMDAFNRAKAIHETKKQQGAEFTESVTTMYELLQELGIIEKK